MHEDLIREWLTADPFRMRALRIARDLDLPDWYLAAGFVRNLVWDRLHKFTAPTPLNDIDLIYFDPGCAHREHDRILGARLHAIDPTLPWSVHNQARMHVRNGDPPYASSLDAMRFWVEQETAVGVRLRADGALDVASAFGLQGLFARTITANRHKRNGAAEFSARIARKNWLCIWPDLRVEA